MFVFEKTCSIKRHPDLHRVFFTVFDFQECIYFTYQCIAYFRAIECVP